LVYNSSTSRWENSSGGYVPYTGAVTTVNLGAQTIQAGSFVKAGGTAAQFLKANGSVDSNVYGTGTVTSVALTMPTAFSVANSPITTAGTLAVTGAGTVGQYIRGDGSLADFPESSGGGSSVSYYLNGSVNQGTIGGVAYKELNKVPIIGTGTDFTIAADGYIASFITDAGDPNLLEIPAGNWNFETYFSASSSGGTPSFYVELYKVNSGGTATLIASNSGFPEFIAFGTIITSYFSTLAVPTTALALTDRLAIRYYVVHSGRTITLHTEDNHLCQIITTFTTGLTALNGLTAQVQNFAVGTSGTDFAIASATATHTFNLPTASATNRGALSSADWTTFNSKQNALTNPVTGTGTTNYLPKFTGTSTIGNSLIADNGTNRVSVGTGNFYDSFVISNSGTTGWEFSNNGSVITYNRNTSAYIPMTFEASTYILNRGNLGLGVTPSAWNTAYKAFQFGTTGAIFGESGDAANYFTTNTFVDSVGFKYITSDWALGYFQENGVHSWRTTATSGTAGAAISFTQAMTLDASGRLALGGTTVTDNTLLNIQGSSATHNVGIILNKTNAIAQVYGIINQGPLDIYNYTSSTYMLRITTAGRLLLGDVSSDNGARLQVSGTSTFSDNINTNRGNDRANILFNTTAGVFRWGMGLINSETGSNVGGDFTLFRYNDNGTFNNFALTVNRESGNVGIGTYIPSQLLHLQTNFASSSGVGTALQITSDGAGGDQAWIGVNKGAGNGLEFSVENRDIIFNTGATTPFGGSERMRITSGGNLLIGTINDTGGDRKLQVAGNLFVDDNSSTGNGVQLRNANRPLITRGWDAFTSGNKNGVGRWGIFMESAELFLGSPGTDYNTGLVTIGGWLADGTKEPNLTVNNYTRNVLIGTATSGASKLRIVGLPTSSVGLSSGDVYNLSGVLMIA
jgi:hypothetical protein